MKTSNKLLLALLILILLSTTTIVGVARYYQTKFGHTGTRSSRH